MKSHFPQTDEFEAPAMPMAVLVARMKSRLAEADLDCRCRDEIENRLHGLVDENALEAFAAALARARNMRAVLGNMLAYLAEIEDLGPEECDVSAFLEAAGLFDDIGHVAAEGASAMRAAAAIHPGVARARTEPFR